MIKQSIAWRITLVLTGLISLAVCLAALTTYLVYLRTEDSMMRELVQTESKRLVTRISRFGDHWTQPFERDMGPSMSAWGESAEFPADGLPDELRGLSVGLHELDRGTSTWHVAVANAMDGRLYVLYDSIVLEQPKRAFARDLIGIVLGFSALAMLISSAVARWLTTPLNLLVERLTRWAPSSGVTEIAHANEADRLMEVFNRVQDQVDASIADQREFSANLHHEIRTPLTIIRSDAEILLRRDVMDPASRRSRLERIVRSVHEIDQSLASTFSLAHAQFEDVAPVNLRLCVDDVFENLHREARQAGLSFTNAVEPGHQATLSRQALMTVMRNIIRNAVLHAAPAVLVVESLPEGLQFTNSGPPILPSELPQVFERYFTHRRVDQGQRDPAGPGHGARLNRTGLGLAIAKRVCVMQGWMLEVTSPVSEGRGARFTLIYGR